MQGGRRAIVAAGVGLAVSAAWPGRTAIRTTATGASGMYGLIGKMRATAGQRDALVAILLEGIGAMPDCLSYIVAHDPVDAEAIWITEVWDSEASHASSLALPEVRAAIAKARPLIAGFDSHVVTQPIGGHGLGR
jgi:quinol monooxygenase YgiN